MGLGQSANVWRMLLNRDGPSCHEDWTKTTQSRMPKVCDNNEGDKCDWRTEKDLYLFYCHKSNPSKSGGGVRWYPLCPYGHAGRFAGISDREGHITCVLSRHAISDPKLDSTVSSMTEYMQQHTNPRERIVAVTGGFGNDDSICESRCIVSSNIALPLSWIF